PQIAVSLVVLAYVTSDESYQEAEGMYQRAISIFEANPAHASSDTTLLQQYAGALLNTGLLNSNYGKYKEALGYYDKALAAYKASVGFESEPVAKLLNQIGNVHWYASDFETAGRYYEQALAIHRKTVGSFDRDLGMSLNNIAAVYNKLGRYAEAEQYLQESIHIKERLYGPTSGQVASGLINLAYNCARQGKFNEAKPLHQQGSYYERQHVGPYAKEYGFTLEGASPLYRAWGDYDSSIYFAEAAVDLRKRIYRNLSVVFSEKDIFSHSIFLRNAVDIALSAYLDHPRPEVLARAITHIIGGKEHLADELWARREICCGS
ncbi:tetratricopeptide repeat protein, partial [Sphingobacteriales bacterium CHB3]|nr:tetratricopeptide repeat protein [Sphingobacteriales bacterium CHB3]